MPSTFQTLPAQVAAVLRREIAAGRWPDSLPGERSLAARLRVGRRTVRAALAILRAEGLLSTTARRPSTPATTPERTAGGGRLKVALLLPEPIGTMRHLTALWVHYLMTALQGAEGVLEVFHGRRFFGSGSSRSLEQLVADNPAECWVLGRSSLAMQRWFARSGVPAVMAGGAHPGIPLSSVDMDHRALGRHAAGVLARRGCQRAVLFLGPARQVGDAECEAGLADAGSPSVHSVFVKETPEAVVAAFARALQQSPAPTGFLFASSFAYLAARSWLEAGPTPGEPLTLLARDDEPFLSHLRPPPGRYSVPPEKFAAAIYRAIRQRLAGAAPRATRLMPEFREG